MYLDLDELRRLNTQRLVNLVRDPHSTLLLADYSARAQYDNMWDTHPILLECRGTILAADGFVIAKPFRKFFNLGERPGTAAEAVVGLGTPEITHKLDGSMATLFYSKEVHRYRLATRGSFTSNQAQHATALWHARYADARVDPALTYVFEVIYPENRVVVDYAGRDDLVLIGLIHTDSGHELPFSAVRAEASRLGLPCVDLESQADWTPLHSLDRTNFEGYVLFWPEHQVRVKVKLADYLRIHRMLSGIHEHAVWETLRDGRSLEEVRSLVSEEIRAWIDATAAGFAARFAHLCDDLTRHLALLNAADLDPSDRAQRAQLARRIQVECPRDLIPIVFRALDGKDYDTLLWKILEPSGTGAAPAITLEG